MTGALLALLGVLVGLGMTVIGDMVSEEARDRLDHLPHAILRLAARRLRPAERTAIYERDWLPELIYILKGEETRPVTRLYVGIRFALGILFKARRIADQLNRTAVGAGGLVVVRSFRPLATAGNLLLTLGGALPDVIDRCPSERGRFQSLGWSVLITSVTATVSMWYALTSAMGMNLFGALLVAILWGLCIMEVDHWFIMVTPPQGKGKFLGVMPRVMLALLVGILVSTPIVLRIFESEISGQVSIIKESNAASFNAWQQKSPVQARVTGWLNTVYDLEQVVGTNGAQTFNPATDPTVVGLTSQLMAEQTAAGADYKKWLEQCQLYGGCGSSEGNGPLVQASQQRYDNDEAEIATLNSKIQAREETLETTSASLRTDRLAQAKAALPNAQTQLTIAQNEEGSLTASFNSTNSASNGLLIRLKALDELSAGNSTLQTARVLLFLLFLMIQVLPVTIKLLQRPGNYEKLLRRRIANELSQAEWELRTTPRG